MFNQIENQWAPDNPPLPPVWTKEEDKAFERALVTFPDDGTASRWENIASLFPDRTAEDMITHYDALVYDVYEIDSGRVKLPSYRDDDSLAWEKDTRIGKISFGGSGRIKNESERKKGNPWTEDEHRLFLMGLNTYGKGDWRSISRNVIVTRTPTQVASHAQKFYLRQTASKNERKRFSIHDITITPNSITPVPPPRNYHVQKSGHQDSTFFVKNYRDEDDDDVDVDHGVNDMKLEH